MSSLWTAFKMTIVMTILTGIIYPFVIAGLAFVLFPWQADGSLIVRNGTVVGSELIGQNFSGAGYFQSRPSAAGDKGYDASNSSGSNLGPTNKDLISAVRTRLARVIEVNPGVSADQVPIDLVTASGSGLDPDISPASANLQVARVATARGLSEDQVRALVRSHTSGRWAGILGEARVNVLMLNLGVDELSIKRAGMATNIQTYGPARSRFTRLHDALLSKLINAGSLALAGIPIPHSAVASHGKPISAHELLLAAGGIAAWATVMAAIWFYPRLKRRREARKRIRMIYEARRLTSRETKVRPAHS